MKWVKIIFILTLFQLNYDLSPSIINMLYNTLVLIIRDLADIWELVLQIFSSPFLTRRSDSPCPDYTQCGLD